MMKHVEDHEAEADDDVLLTAGQVEDCLEAFYLFDGRPRCDVHAGSVCGDRLLERLRAVHKEPRYDLQEDA